VVLASRAEILASIAVVLASREMNLASKECVFCKNYAFLLISAKESFGRFRIKATKKSSPSR